MNRKQLYNEIKCLGLQDEVKAVTGKHYTNATNKQLKTIIDGAVAGLEPVGARGSSAFNKLVKILSKKKILLKSEIDEIMMA